MGLGGLVFIRAGPFGVFTVDDYEVIHVTNKIPFLSDKTFSLLQ
jgi:hypothetical protein